MLLFNKQSSSTWIHSNDGMGCSSVRQPCPLHVEGDKLNRDNFWWFASLDGVILTGEGLQLFLVVDPCHEARTAVNQRHASCSPFQWIFCYLTNIRIKIPLFQSNNRSNSWHLQARLRKTCLKSWRVNPVSLWLGQIYQISNSSDSKSWSKLNITQEAPSPSAKAT